ncbi:OmpA family protein [Vibrio sp. HN007]|uniref:OmpA family protein n=1 Tax=Vibrio iocasae TaxID=3098914 RepID=UPI0035D4A935
MSRKDGSTSDNLEMQKLREIVLGKDNQLVKDTVEDNARDIVSNVLTEALHDREKQDGTVRKVLTPLVEKSVEASVVARKDQFVSYLYPLVGSLVRKSVSAFLAELVEQTNELLESSLTYRGLKWRFKAWQAGVSYTQYVVSQTFVFRVEQVLLIHRETGMLLKTVVKDKTQATDGDMVSAMLTAINDFVADSFSNQSSESEQSLDEIKTDDFTLLIKQGPQAFLVAAITGNAPANIGEQLQLTLEDIHSIYGEEFRVFNGDAAPFENTEEQLTDCLLSQQKEEQVSKKKFPWLAVLLILIAASYGGYHLFKQWQLDYKAWQVHQLEQVPGIVLLSSERCDDHICVELLRDPVALDSAEWLKGVDVPVNKISIHERPYQSLEPDLIHPRRLKVLEGFPEITYSQADSKFYGELDSGRYQQFRQSVTPLAGSTGLEDLLSEVTVVREEVKDALFSNFLLEQNIKDIEQTSIHFELNKSELGQASLAEVHALSKKINATTDIAYKLKQELQIIVMGASDSVGSENYNLKLSAKRAEAVKNELIRQGVNPAVIRTVGLGILESVSGSRRVILGVIRLRPESTDKVQD